ncbi:hypothetical protein C8A00DRAFT_41803 [Chaetomidium leptoderma]|uniref:GPI inositol-deacylase n=1 Tax=Chaetomidium leptoderma TaxID=669021 RepID=A0AAN6ZYL3_9PEZI|nr:hypothetical protein C8A00DRAFT_41803 [Chaetomidium leptoderma]
MASHPIIAPGDHIAFMKYAVKRAQLSPPSPSKFCVGAVLVDADRNEILSTGYSEELPRDRLGDPGSTHAEHCCFIKVADMHGIHDFDIAKVLPPNTVLYTTMEPCNERLSGNRTCVERILGLGGAIKTVYVGIREPGTFIKLNEGIKRLEEAGVKVRDRLSTAITVVDDASSDTRGPLGLNLLHAPSEPRFDLIFVHGLGGGSRKTWSKTSSIRHYWPGEWLPKDPAFKNVRIHSFGYDSDWAKGNNGCLNIHHIGKSLLGELSTSPHVGDSNTDLFLIGHSMGGLVIKKAYMLAHQGAKSLANRIRAIYFLGTPHRGSDSARLLKNILQVASSAPAFVTDLVRGSGALQSINDEFRQYSADVELWSFYETQKLRAGVPSALIVDPESATLGYREENQMPMSADHRSICKFDDPSDQNYVIIRNCLVSSMKKIAATDARISALSQRDSIQSLASYLGVANQAEDDLLAVQEARAHGTCAWILEKQFYDEWKTPEQNAPPPILWVGGKPGTGKSVLAGSVVDDISRSGMPCSYYFFKHGDSSKSRLSACLRSLAFQMASVDPGVQSFLMKLQEDRFGVDHENERTLWRALFASGILGTTTLPHYWVIDALDECDNFTPFLESMLSKLDTSLRLRIFITSRETPELCRLFASLGPRRHWQEHISAEETLPDIERIVTAKGGVFFTDSEESRLVLERRIIEKSKGSFLWTLLVLDELSTAFSEGEIKRVLDEVPRGMEPLYQRTLDTMALATRGKSLAKAILTWTTCVTRPLTIRELECALEIDLKDKFPRLGETIRTLCGQLVTVDMNGKVQMVHESARDFLLDDGRDSEFAVNRTEAHTRIAKVCLEYLVGDEMKPPRTERRGSSFPKPRKKSEFLAYSNATFSSHLAKADPAADHVLALVDKFLSLNILTWIHNVAETKNLKTYARSCMGVRSWSTDLQRVAAKFADALIVSPAAIYSRLPPFSAPGKKLSVAGLPAYSWDDRLSCLDFDEFLAVGLRDGRVVLYHPHSSQEYRSLSHGETVMHLQFREQSDMLASSGLRTIHVWNVRTGQQLYRLLSPRRCIGLTFCDTLLMATSNQNELHSWDLDHEAAEQTKRSWRDGVDDGSPFLSRPPSAFSIAVAHRMAAIAYTGKPVTVWDLEQDAYYGSCGKKLPSGKTSTDPIVALVFNPNASIELLAASYLDGELVIIDPFTDKEVEKQRVSCHTLSASPDGRLLAGGGAGGVIQIFEFDTLRLLYKLKSSDIFIKALAFSRDGASLADLRGSQCNIWIPPVLLAGASLDDTASVDTSSTESSPTTTKVKITALTLIPNRGGILCGKKNGSVSVYDTNSGDHTSHLYSHKDAVRTLCWLPRSNTVMSTCLSNGILAWSLERSTRAAQVAWTVTTCTLDTRLDCDSTIVHLLPEEDGGKFIVSTNKSDHLWKVSTGKEESLIIHDHYPPRIWLQHPRSKPHAICVKQTAAHVYRWHDLSEVVSVSLADGRLVFLDNRSWVCSVDLNGAGAGIIGTIASYARHFFVPYDWFAGTRCPVGGITDHGDIVFARHGDVAVIKGGLDYSEVVEVSESPKLGDGP